MTKGEKEAIDRLKEALLCISTADPAINYWVKSVLYETICILRGEKECTVVSVTGPHKCPCITGDCKICGGKREVVHVWTTKRQSAKFEQTCSVYPSGSIPDEDVLENPIGV